MGKLEQNKQQKRDSLLDSAFMLFLDNGFGKTSISDIVNHAGVAKGTFYLYFKDKYDIRNHLIQHKATQVFQAAYDSLMGHPECNDFEDQILFFVDHILNQLAANTNLVLLLSKHLSWGFFKDSILKSSIDTSNSNPTIYETYLSLLNASDKKYRNPEIMMYLIIELISCASYNSILFSQPCSLDELKPHLYESIRSLFQQYRIHDEAVEE